MASKEVSTHWHWNCASSLCTNSWRSKIPGLKFYYLEELKNREDLRSSYLKILKNANINWKKAVICSEHWSNGERGSVDDLPDVICTPAYLSKLKKSKKKTKQRKRRLKAAENFLEQKKDDFCATKKPERSAWKARVQARERQEGESTLKANDSTIENALKEQLKNKEQEIEKLRSQLEAHLEQQKRANAKIDYLLAELQKTQFTYDNLHKQPNKLFELTGLTTVEFDCLFECIEPFVYLVQYPDCKNQGLRRLDMKTELMVFFTICRHALHLSIAAWMTQTSDGTISRIFTAWAVFLSTIFECLDLSPLPGFIEKFLPNVFKSTGFVDTGLLGDATETWIGQSENFEVNNITFSNYKNHTTGKTSVWIFPHGGLLCCTDTYPGSISDHDITQQSGVLDTLNKGKVVLTDKGFDIAELCHSKGLLHNRPPTKFDAQYEQADVSANFDIATLRIYNENYIGRIRDWSILNSCWPMTRIDLLGLCFKIFAHIVNMLKTPVGPH